MRNTAVIAAAGARKTQSVIDAALEAAPRRVLITTYTNENLRQIERRLYAAAGLVPRHIRLSGWFSFLLSDGIRPYQSAVLPRTGMVRGLNFVADRPRVKSSELQYFLDRNGDVWRDATSDLACKINSSSSGQVIARLEAMFDHILVDEVQDLVGYDLDFLDLLFKADFDVTVVGDPRQCLFSTNNWMRNKRYRGAGFVDWLAERAKICEREDRVRSYRCNQEICDFASDLFPAYPRMVADCDDRTGHDGIQTVSRFDVLEYVEEFRPQVLRASKRANTQGLSAMNFGVSKGSTFDRVLIFPTKPMLQYLDHRDPSRLKQPESLYVAVTRARYSVAFVV